MSTAQSVILAEIYRQSETTIRKRKEITSITVTTVWSPGPWICVEKGSSIATSCLWTPSSLRLPRCEVCTLQLLTMQVSKSTSGCQQDALTLLLTPQLWLLCAASYSPFAYLLFSRPRRNTKLISTWRVLSIKKKVLQEKSKVTDVPEVA